MMEMENFKRVRISLCRQIATANNRTKLSQKREELVWIAQIWHLKVKISKI